LVQKCIAAIAQQTFPPPYFLQSAADSHGRYSVLPPVPVPAPAGWPPLVLELPAVGAPPSVGVEVPPVGLPL
jgi:hypothetical protein